MKSWKLILVLTIINCAAALVSLVRAAPDAVAQTTPQVVRAQKIELVDEQGRVRARLNTETDGEVIFRLIGQNGDIRAKFGASDKGSGLVLMNDTAQPGVHMLAKRSGTFVKVIDTQNRQRALEP